MATNANLPAGFTITSINGKRCTQVPRSLTTIAGETSFVTTTSEAAAQTTVSTTSTTPPSPPQTTTSSSQAQGNPSPVVAVSVSPPSNSDSPTSSITPLSSPALSSSVISTSSAVPTSFIATTPLPETTTSAPLPISTMTPIAVSETLTQAAASSTSTSISTTSTSNSETSASASPASKGTTPTFFSSTSIPLAQSEVSATPSSTGILDSGLLSSVSSRTSTTISSSISSTHAAETSTGAGISSNPKLATAPVVGGVMGGLALVGIIGLMLWLCRRRKSRQSMLTPLTTSTREKFYDIDRGSIGPTKPMTQWGATLGYQTEKLRDVAGGFKAGLAGLVDSLKSKISGEDKMNVNMNRGNSQFMDGSMPQHSRNNSSISSNHARNPTLTDRIHNIWERAMEKVNANGRRDRQSRDIFASARRVKQKQAVVSTQPDFSQLLGMEERELQLQAERRRASLTQSYGEIGDLGLNFSTRTQQIQPTNPFADPPIQPSSQDWKPPSSSTTQAENPFANPITAPALSIPNPSSYLNSIRRSHGLSLSNITQAPTTSTANAIKTPSIAPASRYPSTLAPARDSYRDTVFSLLTTTTRHGKGRSDPFDLEPLDWRRPPMPAPTNSTLALYPEPLRTAPDPLASAVDARLPLVGRNDSVHIFPAVDKRKGSETGTYDSKYSSGMSLGGWGGPGPDVGSLEARNEAAVAGARIHDAGSAEVMKGSLTEMSPGAGDAWDARRRMQGSPVSFESGVSKASSRGGVGKAM